MDEDQEGIFYQVVVSCHGKKTWVDAVGWLSEQVGYEFPTGEVIEHIDNFQFVRLPDDTYRVVATCSVYRPIQDR